MAAVETIKIVCDWTATGWRSINKTDFIAGKDMEWTRPASPKVASKTAAG